MLMLSRPDEREASYYLGSKPVRLEDLGATLKPELSRRPTSWPVYLIADPELDWRTVAEAIDAVRGEGADVILVPREPVLKP